MKNPHKMPNYEIFHNLINFVKITKIINIYEINFQKMLKIKNLLKICQKYQVLNFGKKFGKNINFFFKICQLKNDMSFDIKNGSCLSRKWHVIFARNGKNNVIWCRLLQPSKRVLLHFYLGTQSFNPIQKWPFVHQINSFQIKNG